MTAVVGRWDEQRHLSALGDGRRAYFLGLLGDQPAGFAILRDWASAERVTLLKRIAVSRPGNGIGRALLRAVIEKVFRDTQAHRLWLGVFPEDLRARRAYAAAGFVPEGVARGSAFFGGVHRDALIMSILRTDGAQTSVQHR
ncbi:MAG TPA: GNAT family N-acetyltransferase [Bosea sp. (in: a-proteobacteria)]|jgi:RimJ/RimL family protein N-acetyltransferase|uniref:GNAT family N-acetyltransferase n=1 Tax=Bosea sp. (in: a-proteobacteria) TaxID=1871050 RepID=UPI002E0E7C35|nr:GNAT family N-acetyltransferase [Bosea sp. (in: a-proteobacteria)]